MAIVVCSRCPLGQGERSGSFLSTQNVRLDSSGHEENKTVFSDV